MTMIHDRRGFTVLELIVAVGILGLLLSFASLAQSQLLPHYRLQSATRQVVTDLRLLRSKAISQDARFRMIFDAGAGDYRAERRNPATGTWEPYALYRRGGTTAASPRPVSLPGSVIAASATEVTFFPRGTVVVTGGSAPIVLSAPGPRTRNITINLAGLIAIS